MLLAGQQPYVPQLNSPKLRLVAVMKCQLTTVNETVIFRKIKSLDVPFPNIKVILFSETSKNV